MNGGGGDVGAGFGSGSVEAPAVVVLCDCYDHDGNPLASNARVAAEKIFASIAGTGHDTQFTAHQQYVLLIRLRMMIN
jgi:glutamine synthetase